jgi:hypothetical protein
MLMNLKNDQQRFYGENVFCTYKDYSSFLGGKLTMFKLCNYSKGKSCDIFRLFRIILLFMKLILLLVNFSITIRATSAYFIVYALFPCLCFV